MPYKTTIPSLPQNLVLQYYKEFQNKKTLPENQITIYQKYCFFKFV